MGLIRKALASRPLAALTSPYTIDHYIEQIHPMLAVKNVRARVVEVIRETGAASTVVLRPNGAWVGFRPGQHVQFGIEVDGKRRIRCFSVSSSGFARGGYDPSTGSGRGKLNQRGKLNPRRTFSVSVKAHPDGYVSQFLHHELAPGTLVYLSQAEGEFVLPEVVPDKLLLVSGGSGITPLMSMLRTLRDAGHLGQVTFLHYARSREDEMFTAELDELTAAANVQMMRIYTRVPEPQAELAGRFVIDHLKHLGIDPVDTLTYVCGPAGLIATVRDTYEEIGATDQLRMEYFKVPTVDPSLFEQSAAEATGTLTFDDADIEADNSGATILEQAEAAGLTPDFGCRMGVCNTCAIKKNSGAVRHVISGEISADTDETIKICVNVPVGDVNVAL